MNDEKRTPDAQHDREPELLRLPHYKRPTLDIFDVVQQFGEDIALQWQGATPDRRMAMEGQLLKNPSLGRPLTNNDAAVDVLLNLMALTWPCRIMEGAKKELVVTRARYRAEIEDFLEKTEQALEEDTVMEIDIEAENRLQRRYVQVEMLGELIKNGIVTYDAVLQRMRSRDELIVIDQMTVANAYRHYLMLLLSRKQVENIPSQDE